MSVNNGIYILKTGKEYRVRHINPLDFLYEKNSKDVYVNDLNPVRVLLEFGNCQYTSNADLAIKIAFRQLEEFEISDCSIKIIDAKCYWRDIVKLGVEVATEEIKLYPDEYDVQDCRMHEKKWLEEVIHKYSENNKVKHNA